MKIRNVLIALVRWFDAEAGTDASDPSTAHIKKVDWVRCLPFIGIHAMCLGVIWVGFSWAGLCTSAAFYFIRMFSITAGYHRYFAHRTYRTSRPVQFAFAVLGSTCMQRGPLWWAAHHRNHHRYSDTEKDVHSPRIHGFWWAHMGWFTSRSNFATDYAVIPDFARYPELRFLNRFDMVVPILTALAMVFWGRWLNVGGMHMLIWGFFISTTVLFHGTFTINSLSHVFGRRRFETNDDSRNNFCLSLITLGEGWHNNHHYYATTVRQGFYWWELDVSYYLLKVMSWVGLVWDLRPVSAHVYEDAKLKAKTGPSQGVPESTLA